MQVLKTLCDQPMMNGEMAEELGLSTGWVRRQVKWLQDHGLVQELTDSKPNYKLYGITEQGQQIVEVL